MKIGEMAKEVRLEAVINAVETKQLMALGKFQRGSIFHCHERHYGAGRRTHAT